MTRDEQLIKAALDMAAETCEKSAYAADADGHHFAYSIRAITPADVLAKVGDVAPAVAIEPPRLMAMCGHCRSAGEEYCVQYLKDLRWDGAEWCCKDCFDWAGDNGEWDEAPQPCPQPTPDAVARLIDESDNLLPVFLATAARNIDFDGPWDDFDLAGGLRSLIAEMETNHDH